MSDTLGMIRTDDQSGEPIPISAVQHAVYCLRQAALIHLERLWGENRYTAEGRVLHAASEVASARKLRGVRRVTALPLASQRLGIAGVADLVEFHTDGRGGEIPYPVEFKRGRAKLHRADEVQLCAQALCLEEMTDTHVQRGALFYAETRRRVEVSFDVELRALTEATVADLKEIFTTLKTPPPTLHKARCRACSLLEQCRPGTVARPARAWRDRMVERLLATPADPP